MNCVVIGDMGKGTPDQFNVSKAMKRLYKKHNIEFVLGVGDNIYPSGCSSVNDPLFKTHFEEPYSILPNDKWYMCLGNHDYGYDYDNSKALIDNSQHQIEYTKKSKKWFMPSKYYSFTKGPVEFFYLDSNLDRMSESVIQKQLHIMKERLDKSKKKWKVVVGHHTWRSIAGHGNAEPRYETFLNDLFKDTKPNLYMCGHDHCKSIIIKDGITLVISGNGGEVYDEPNVELSNMHDCQLDYFSPSLGFAILKIKKGSLGIEFYNNTGFKEYSHTVKK
jgi:tartrate-resistant acid phosphatase type 5